MKGPYGRLRYDLRRVWECPVCRQRLRTDGTVVGSFCDCQKKQPHAKQVCMRLVEDGTRLAKLPAVVASQDQPA